MALRGYGGEKTFLDLVKRGSGQTQGDYTVKCTPHVCGTQNRQVICWPTCEPSKPRVNHPHGDSAQINSFKVFISLKNTEWYSNTNGRCTVSGHLSRQVSAGCCTRWLQVQIGSYNVTCFRFLLCQVRIGECVFLRIGRSFGYPIRRLTWNFANSRRREIGLKFANQLEIW